MTRTNNVLKHRIVTGHLKYIGIKSSTKWRYELMIAKFYNFLAAHRYSLPADVDELDFLASEFVNYLWLSGDSQGYANDFVSGLSRYIPRSRKAIPVTRLYIQNWQHTLKRARALPLTVAVVKALCGVAVVHHKPRLACALLVGFVGLLRTDEIIRMQKDWIQFNTAGTRAVIALHDSKRGQ